MPLSEIQIIQLDTVDSTNNYAMQLIDANKAQHATVITARSQAAGKGQRGKTWEDVPGQSLLMSIVIFPKHTLTRQFEFNATVTVAIAEVIQNLIKHPNVYIKWPNDIIINDKKAGGILIENILRGSSWSHAVVGIGINLYQDEFPGTLPYATSLKIVTGNEIDINALRDELCKAIVEAVDAPIPADTDLKLYNEFLYKRGSKQKFSDKTGQWYATVLLTLPDGTLQVQLESGAIVHYQHGQVTWEWGDD